MFIFGDSNKNYQSNHFYKLENDLLKNIEAI